MTEIQLVGLAELRAAHNVLVEFFEDDVEPVPAWEVGDFRLLETLSACTEVYDKYLDIPSKAAKLFYSGVKLHCFPNANKRFGLMVLILFLVINDLRLTAPQGEMIDLATWVAESKPHLPDESADKVIEQLITILIANTGPRES